MDHIAIAAICDLMDAVIRTDVTHQEMESAMDKATQDLTDLGISESFIQLVIDFAENIATGLTIELEEV